MSKPDAILVADGVLRRFGGLIAVNVDHAEVQRGEITALIGPNGAGKTTFFNLLTGFDVPDAGTWQFEGQDVGGVAAFKVARRGMVRTFQLTKSLARLSVMQNMLLGATGQTGEKLWVGPFPWIWRRREREITVHADALLERFRLDHMRDEFAGNLSGGQRKLLEMARALMTDPTLIMLDEPMAGVNPALKQTLLAHIKELKNEGRTVLFVEHDMDMVHEISDWVLVMTEGRLIAEGTPAAISGNRQVIDAYLGAHHDVDIGAMDEAQAIEELGLDAEELGLDQLEHIGEISHDVELGEDAEPAVTGDRPEDAAGGIVSDAAATTNVIEATDVVAGYVPEVNILNGCNLTVAPGEFVGIIGPNGAGKSTLLKAMLGMVPVRAGTIALHGDDITGQRAHRLVQRGVGFVPQSKNVFQALTVRENLEMGCFLAPKRFAERYEVVTGLFPRLAERADQRAGSLSGGERQMVAMGRALMLDPSLLLLDEPSAGLSPMLQDEVFLRCKLINDQGVAILMVEQNARRCLQVCHRGYVLDQGRNAYSGTGRELLADPKVIELYLGTLARA